MQELKIEYLSLNQLKPYDKNARKHQKDDLSTIKASIQEFGMSDPIGVWGENNIIVEGHGRYLSCKELGIDKVPVIHLDHLTDEQRRAYALAHNKTAEMSEWDFDLLGSELDDILDIDMTDFGFNITLDEEEQEVVEDDFDGELPEEPKAKLGDIYQLGNHRLMCGDSTLIDDVELLMGGHKADMVFTDPPYGYNYQSNMREKSQKFDVIENDDKILDFFPNIQMVCNGFIFICTTWKVLDKWIPLFKKYHDLSNMIIWNKGGGGIGDLKHTFSTDYEVILCASNGKEITGKRIGSVWTIGKDTASSYVHPTQKPIKLSEFAIRNTTNRNDNVLDLFGGSGSTLMGCEQLERNCYMMEYDPKYVDVIIARWEKFTGKKAVLLNDESRD